MPLLSPKMHWVSKEDGKFQRAMVNLDYRVVQPVGEDVETEPQRTALVRAILGSWEQEYLEGKAGLQEGDLS